MDFGVFNLPVSTRVVFSIKESEKMKNSKLFCLIII
jgi:hypothetical protein